MNSFDDAFAAVIGEEGGYVNDSEDAGGETKFGISKAAFPEIDIKNLTLDQAKDLYRKNYWTPILGDAMRPKMALAVFDFAVNAGVSASVKTLQRVIGVDDDGKVGPGTLAAANKKDIKDFALTFAVERVLHYASQTKFPKYGRGWVTRAVTVAMNNT